MSKTVQELVHEQVAAKIAAGEALEVSVRSVEKAQADLINAEAEAARLRRAALKAGWNETELRSLGLASKTRTRRRPTGSNPNTTPADNAPSHSDGEPG